MTKRTNIFIYLMVLLALNIVSVKSAFGQSPDICTDDACHSYSDTFDQFTCDPDNTIPQCDRAPIACSPGDRNDSAFVHYECIYSADHCTTPDNTCYHSALYSAPCGTCGKPPVGGDPQAVSACVNININGQTGNADLIAGQTYTANVSMRNIGTSNRDSWGLTQHWPQYCDGMETPTNPESDAMRTNDCPIRLILVNPATGSEAWGSGTYMWGLENSEWIPRAYSRQWKCNWRTGVCGWQIVAENGNHFAPNIIAPNPLGYTVNPKTNALVNFSFNIKAPTTTGLTTFAVRMSKVAAVGDEYLEFGQMCSIDVNVLPATHTISGKLWLMQNFCNETHNSSYANSLSMLEAGSDMADINNAHTYTGGVTNKVFSIANIPHGLPVNSLYITNATLTPPVDYIYIPSCFKNDPAANGGNGVMGLNETVNVNETNWDIGYKQVSNLDGWFTVQDGDVFSNNLINVNMPTNPPAVNLFAGYLIEKSPAGMGGYAFSNSNIDVATQANTPRIYQTNGGGYVKYLIGDMASSLSFWPNKYSTFKAPDNTVAFTSTTLNTQLAENTVYLVDSAASLSALNNFAATTYSVANNGTTIIMVTQPGTVTFKHNLRVAAGNTGRLIFVLGKGVNATLDRNIGYSVAIDGEPTINSRPNIEAAIIGTDENSSITFLGTANKNTSPDTTIIMEGPVVAATTSLKRNKGDNNSTPAEVIKYRSKYMYDLTNWERSNNVRKTGLFVTDVVYQYDN